MPAVRVCSATAALLLLVLAGGCARYQMGAQSLYPAEIRTVYVPMFESGSFRRNVGEWLTEAVVKEIQLKTPYRVVHTPTADSVLTGRVLHDQKRVRAEDPNDEPRDIQFDYSVQMSWFNRQGELLAHRTISAGDNFIPEGGQSVASVQSQVIRRLARQIVAQMEATNW